MTTILTLIALLIAVCVVCVLIYAATLPKQFRIVRSTTISASPERVFPLINDLRKMNEWNPFANRDPTMAITYTGPAEGKGAGFHWDSTGRGGKGSMETLDAVPFANVTLRLDMEKPMEGHNTVVFALRPVEGITEVSWTMFGPFPYINRVFGTIFNINKMLGGQFDQGLADLKTLAEK